MRDRQLSQLIKLASNNGLRTVVKSSKLFIFIDNEWVKIENSRELFSVCM